MLTDTSRDRARWKDLTDEELMLKVQGGETDCYDVLVERYKNRLFNYLLRLTGNRDEAEEFAQEALVKAYIHAEKYKTIAKFSTWLYTIATNLVRNRVRSRSRAPQIFSLWTRVFGDGDDERVVDIPDDSQRSPEEAINDNELSEIISAAIQKIPEKYRTSFVLREVNEMSYEEIAAVTGLKLGTVRSRINRARNHFRQLIAPVLEKGIDF
ncbi:MAG TPA: sigma-70 family RNA polymerase sigma factor [Candidatus Krumholzibacteria bacterium]|nr:sigma-70 family RNA polymerase sigma factor [Candidatus Krumholzibacteria bacterium]